MVMRHIRINKLQRGLLYHRGEYRRVLQPGSHWIFGFRKSVVILDATEHLVDVRDLDVLVAEGALHEDVRIVDLKDHERALVRIDGRMEHVLGRGLHAVWTVLRDVEVEVEDVRTGRLDHADLSAIAKSRGAYEHLELAIVEPVHQGLLYVGSVHTETLGPGVYALWKSTPAPRIVSVDLREQMLDVGGQEIMTADKVTLRLNAQVDYRVSDALKTVTVAGDAVQALYRQTQLALRAEIGTRQLDVLLTEKDGVARALERTLVARAKDLGLTVLALGIRDVILPGEMKDLMNRVTEARKAAEAALIHRREETAAMRSQANTARILEKSPTLMRLRELEVLEKVADKANLTVVLGESGLADKVVKLL